ncbi:MAG: stage II sporulation protein R [Clostridiaceae bacterium]|nr:stage II sporulation protein R [Clostridiaceae bacterium]
MKKLLTTLVLSILCAALALACALAYDLTLEYSIASKVTRLQIIAHSDTDADQSLKLAVRDRVLEIATRVTQGCAESEDARARLRAALPEIERAASETVYASGRAYTVHASLGEVAYPFRDYGTFALPEGDYTALRVILGDGAGHNWWCVAFPALCEPAANIHTAAAAAGLSSREIAFIRSDGAKGRFFLLELWERWF